MLSKSQVYSVKFLLKLSKLKANNDILTNVIDAIQDRKGIDISILDLSAIEGASTGRFVICTGRSTSQTSAIADNVREKLQKECGRKPNNYDGYKNSQWIVLDYGDFMVHVFLPDVRTFYNLEELWSDAPIERIPDLD